MHAGWIRFVAGLCALGSAGIAAAAGLPSALHYEVFDGDKRVGDVRISLQASEHGLVVRQQAEIALHRMMMTATVRQSIEERWQGADLQSLHAETASASPIGDAHKTLAVERVPSGGLRATADGTAHELPGNALPLTIWSARTLVPGPHFELAGGALASLQAAPAADGDEAVRYQDQPCRPSSFASTRDGKKSVMTAWLGDDEIVCRLRIRSGRDVFTYVRRPLS